MHNLSTTLAIIKVNGTDSKKYLQGQLTNDINLLDTENFQFSAHLNNKGRMLASFIITKDKSTTEDIYYMTTTYDIVDKIIPRLKMFVLRSKVTIEKLDKKAIIFSNQKIVPEPLIQFYGQYSLSIVDNDQIPDGCENCSYEWHNFIINSGFPFIYSKTQELFIPQQVNFDLINGINFKKGCYTGQEIIARTHYRGKIKRRMFRGISDYPIEPGTPIVSPKMGNQEIGVIVDVIKREFNYMALLSIQSDLIEDAYLDTENKKQLLIQPLQYGS